MPGKTARSKKRKGRRRGAKGRGTVFFSKARQVWIGRKPVGRTAAGRTRYREFWAATEGDVVEKMEAASAPGPDTTVGAWADRWLAGQGNRPATLRSYGYDVVHIKAHLGTVRLRDLTPTRVEEFAARLGKSLHVNTVRKTVAALRNMLGGAVRDGVIDSNPAAVAKKPKAKKKKIDPFTPAELAVIVREAVAPCRRILALLAAVGCRVGEAMALDVPDYDAGAGTISITKTFERVLGMGPPKSPNSVRTIRVPPQARPALEAAIGGRKKGPLFVSEKGNRLILELVRHAWVRYLKRLGYRFRNLHQLRHSVGTAMMGAKYSPADVAKYLGDTPATIINTYCHATGQDPSLCMDGLLQGGDKVGEKEAA